MSAVPRLLAGQRRALAALLVALALGEAALAVLFAAALDRLLEGAHPPLMALLGAGGIAAMAAAALLLARWVGEDFAQSFVGDCRAALFAAVTRQAGEGMKGDNDARWLTVLINDMAALRHYALRGTVRLWTSTLAACAASIWVMANMPELRPAMVPLLLGAAAIILVTWPLSNAVATQRAERGRLNRFLVRRVRAELAGEVSPRGHGFKKLAELSGNLARASVRRARSAGAMDALATFGGLAAALVLVWQTSSARAMTGIEGLAGSLTLLGFIAARLLESARALHARIGGRLALARLARLLEPQGGQGRRIPRSPARSSPRAWAARLLGWRLALPPPDAAARASAKECRP
jgi:ABC-type multidrug transport system fused ATPase/permease subunit